MPLRCSHICVCSSPVFCFCFYSKVPWNSHVCLLRCHLDLGWNFSYENLSLCLIISSIISFFVAVLALLLIHSCHPFSLSQFHYSLLATLQPVNYTSEYFILFEGMVPFLTPAHAVRRSELVPLYGDWLSHSLLAAHKLFCLYIHTDNHSFVFSSWF